MKTHTAYFTFHTRSPREYLNITDRVAAEVEKSAIAEGMVLARGSRRWHRGRSRREKAAKFATCGLRLWRNPRPRQATGRGPDRLGLPGVPSRSSASGSLGGASVGSEHERGPAPVNVSAMHITAGVWVNDAESGLLADMDQWLERLAPFRADYQHHRTGESNGDAHLKSLLVHHEVIVPVTAGRLDFGPWQQIYYAEFDGQRPKRVVVKVMEE